MNSEDEARAALAQRRQEAREAGARETRERYGAMAAPRVSTPPSEECTHEAWEEYGAGRRCADCRQYLDTPATPPTDEEDADDIEDALITLLLDEGLESARGYGQPTATDVATALLKKFAISSKGEA